MITICVSIGNSDNKLTQDEWYRFVQLMDDTLRHYEKRRHFFGGSETYAPWQNVCWLCVIEAERLPEVRSGIYSVRTLFKQESAFLLHGEGEFV